MTVKQVFYIFLQVVGMVVFIICGFAAGYIYFVGEQKNAAKRSEHPVTIGTADTALTVEHPQSEPQLQALEPVSFSQPLVRAKSKSRPAPARAVPVKPVAYSAPKKAAPVAKPKAATKPVAPTKTQVRKMVINSADRMDYSAPKFRTELKEQAKSILQFRATDNNAPAEVKRAKFNTKIGGAGMSETEQAAKKSVEMEKIKSGLKDFWANGAMGEQ